MAAVRSARASAGLALRRGGWDRLGRWDRLARRALATAPTPGASTLDAPFISDTMPLAEGVIGELGELCVAVGDQVSENDVVAVIETGACLHSPRTPPNPSLTSLPFVWDIVDKAAINVKASQSGVIAAILVEIDEPITECMPMFELR